MLGRSMAARTLAALVAVAALASATHATTLRRMGLSDLARTNERVVVGKVVDAKGRWNAEGSFMVTDVVLAVEQVVKGPETDRLELTIMGGVVGDLTTLIVGGAELTPGGEYVLFLTESELPGEPSTLTVRDHCQGAFDVVRDAEGARALSQARHQPLLTDDRGVVEPPGGADGLPLADLLADVSRAVAGPRK
jgi:hypothetical protein